MEQREEAAQGSHPEQRGDPTIDSNNFSQASQPRKHEEEERMRPTKDWPGLSPQANQKEPEQQSTTVPTVSHSANERNSAHGFPLDLVLSRLDCKQSGNGYTAKCPAHDDKNPSLSIGRAPDGTVLLKCFAGCVTKDIVKAMGLVWSDLFPRKMQSSRVLAVYDYQDEYGTLLFQAVRYAPKTFKFRRPDGKGDWIWKLGTTQRVLYHLRDLLTADMVLILEGEKDVETARELGLVATCNPGGAEKWRPEYSEALRGKHIVILPDNDESGEKHALQVARSVFPVAASLKVVRFPDLPDKGDFTDWRKQGHGKEDLLPLIEAAAFWTQEEQDRAPEEEQERTESLRSEPAWPVLADEALYGLAGEIVNTIDPFTEADKAAVLLNVLTAFGNTLNGAPHARAQHDRHPANLFVVQVGETSKGRKGTGWSTPRYLMSMCDKDWSRDRVKSGLSSGEGLIYNVRDPVYEQVPIKEKGRFTGDYETVCTDPGEPDKRLLIVEPEFASVLTVGNREGNTLSPILRQAWDSGKLSPLTRNNPITANGAHISIIGHITKQELLARLDDTSKANGFGNRFIWAMVKRSKELPEGGAAPDELLQPLVDRLVAAMTFARTVTAEIKRDAEATALWAAVYHDLSEGKPGMLGAMLARAEAQVLRLSVIYALLDESKEVREEHLKAALALWDYCERSTVLIFGERLGDPTADRILEALRNAGPQGMTDNDVYELFGKHKSANERTRAMNILLSLGIVESTKEATPGRPRTVYRIA